MSNKPQDRFEEKMLELSSRLNALQSESSSYVANVAIRVWGEVHELLTGRSRDELAITSVHRKTFQRAYSDLVNAVQIFGIMGRDLKLPYNVPRPPEYFDRDDL